MRRLRALLVAWPVLLALLLAGPADAQSSRDAQRRLDKVKQELKQVAAERRRLEGQRGTASSRLRQADEQLGGTSRALHETETRLVREQATLAQLQRRRAALQSTLAARRSELAALLRAAYTVGGNAPLKLMLAQDRIADGNRLLTWHRYLQQQRAQRIGVLTDELADVDRLEREIARKRLALDAARAAQRAQLAALERDRRAQAQTVAQLEQRYRDRKTRELALGRDAKALQRLLTQLRAAARRADAERKAAARAASKSGKPGNSASSPGSGKRRPAPAVVANAAPIQVGGLSWPLAGSLLAGFGGTLPDGRSSQGVLIAAPAGSPVKAVANGRVVFAEWMTGYGLILIVDHGNGYMSLYAHNEALLRDVGDSVQRGDPVASVGNSGGQGRPALYFELRRNGQPVNPGAWLQKR